MFLLGSVAIADERPGPRTDLYGDPLPGGAAVRLGTVRWRSAGANGILVYLPDGKTLVTPGRFVNFWDVATGTMSHWLLGLYWLCHHRRS